MWHLARRRRQETKGKAWGCMCVGGCGGGRTLPRRGNETISRDILARMAPYVCVFGLTAAEEESSVLLEKKASKGISSHPSPPPCHAPTTIHSKAKGFEIGCELGYYKACCQTWLAVLRREEKEEEEAEEWEAAKENGGVGLVMDTTTKER